MKEKYWKLFGKVMFFYYIVLFFGVGNSLLKDSMDGVTAVIVFTFFFSMFIPAFLLLYHYCFGKK